MASNIQNNNGPQVPYSADETDQTVNLDELQSPATEGAEGAQGALAAKAKGAADPFAKDEAGRKGAASTVNGNVANAQPFDADYPALKQVFDQYGFQAPTESELRQMQPHAEQSDKFHALVGQVKTSVQTKDDSKLPKGAAYAAAANDVYDAQKQQRLAQQAFQQNTIEKIGDQKSAGSDDIISKAKNPAAIVMLVMLKAKQEITQQKKDDLNQLQKYSTISDLMNNMLNNTYLPAQQELQQKTVAAKKDKETKQEVTVPNIQNVNIDTLGRDENGGTKLMTDSGVDKNGVANPPTISLTQVDMTAKIQEFQNQIQQVGSRVSREQTNYQGHDSQDSTLSNIITSTQKTFADSSSAILRNIQS